MKHAGCRSPKARVMDSRAQNGRVWRRRMCFKCKLRFTTWEIVEEDFELFMQAEQRKNELDAPQWAVISHDHVKATGLTYAEAADMMKKMEGLKGSGLCVVTAAVAGRISGANNIVKENRK